MKKQTNLVPKRRFKEFQNTSTWEQRKLGNHAEILTGGTPNTQIKEYWEPKEIPWMSSGEINKKRLSSTDNMISKQGFKKSSTRWVKENSVLIALAGQGKTRGTVAINEIPLTTNQSIAAIVPNDELYYEFIFQNLEKRYEELRLISSGGGTRGGLNKQLVSDVEIMSPSIEEQIKIGNFLNQLDNLISLQQRKLEKTKALKSAYLSEMFPDEGERVPKRRFAGFTQAWEQRKLNTVFKDFIVPMRDKPKEFSGTVPWTRIEDIEGRYINGTTSGQYVSEETINSMNLKVIPKGSLIVSASATFGVVAIVNNDLITNQTFIGLVPNTNYNIDYLYAFFKSTYIQEKMRRESAGSTIFYISRHQFENMIGVFPVLEEQVKIGGFFRQLEDAITLYQRKLEKLQNLKKAYLNEMFV